MPFINSFFVFGVIVLSGEASRDNSVVIFCIVIIGSLSFAIYSDMKSAQSGYRKFYFLSIFLALLGNEFTFYVNCNEDVRVNSGNSSNYHRTGKNFVLNQPNYEDCTTQTGLKGICMRRPECNRNGGQASGFCQPTGVCCEVNLKCNSITKLKKVTIRNPKPLPTKCVYHVQPYSTNVCQLRIDFDIVLSQPANPKDNPNVEMVTCESDYFQIGDLKLCGTNLNQHIYVPFDVSEGNTDLTFSFNLANLQNPSTENSYWNLLITQLECPPSIKSKVGPSSSATSSPSSLMNGNFIRNSLRNIRNAFRPNNNDYDLLAPPGCLQYFTERQGSFETFNFNQDQGYYFANLRYGICFKRTFQDTGVQFSASHFQMGAQKGVNFIDDDCFSLTDNDGKSKDYLMIPESVLAAPDADYYGTRYCGTSLKNGDLFHAPPGPFAVYFISDELFSTVSEERGFRISYSIIQQ